MRGGIKSKLSVLAISVGIFSVCLISALGDTAAYEINERVAETGLGGITVYPGSSGKKLIDEQIMDDLSGIPGLKALTPFIYKTGKAECCGLSKSTAFIGVNEKIFDIFNMNLLYGKGFSETQIASCEKVAVVDDEFAMETYKRENIVGKRVTFVISGQSQEFTVIGVIRSQKQGLENMMQVSFPNVVYIPYTSLNEITGDSKADKIAISCFSPESEDLVANKVVKMLKQINQISYKYENINGYINDFKETVSLVKIFIKAVAAISLGVGGIGIMNSMLYTVDTRKRDIGIYMALGEGRKSILARFLAEATIVCLIGGVLGIVMTVAMLSGINTFIELSLKLSWGTMAIAVTSSALCGVIFGLLPAERASRLDPIDIISE